MIAIRDVESTAPARITTWERPTPTPGRFILWIDMTASMSDVCYSTVVDPEDAEDCARFEELADRWEDETGHFSSPLRKTKHPCFADMLQIGGNIIPWVMKRLKARTVFWYLILERIGSDPPRIDAAGDMNKLRRLWLEWGRKNGYAA